MKNIKVKKFKNKKQHPDKPDGWYVAQKTLDYNSLMVLPPLGSDGSVTFHFNVLLVRIEDGQETEQEWRKEMSADVPFSNFTADEREWLSLYVQLRTKVGTFVFDKVSKIGKDKVFYNKLIPHKPYRNKDRKPEKRVVEPW